MREHVKEAAMAGVWLRDIVSPGDRAAVMGLRRGPGQDPAAGYCRLAARVISSSI